MKKLVKEFDWDTLEFSSDPEEADYTVYSHQLPDQKWELLGEGDKPGTYAVRVHKLRGGPEVVDMTADELKEVPLGIIRKEEFRFELSPKSAETLRRLTEGQ